jgi:hypothetical protein
MKSTPMPGRPNVEIWRQRKPSRVIGVYPVEMRPEDYDKFNSGLPIREIGDDRQSLHDMLCSLREIGVDKNDFIIIPGTPNVLVLVDAGLMTRGRKQEYAGDIFPLSGNLCAVRLNRQLCACDPNHGMPHPCYSPLHDGKPAKS